MTAINYIDKNILAPMVRIGTLPTRLLALDYGADIVYTEEIIDHKMLKCTRIENALLDTVDFVMKDGTVPFRTCTKESSRLVFQMGTCNAQRALKVSKLVEKDVAAIDINMGCPKEFSIKGGMGAALLTQPEKVKEILTTLVENLNIPVTCKIRILPTLEESISLARLIEKTGVGALAIHGRLKEERPRHSNNNDVIKAISEVLNIPVIANGGSKEINCYHDIEVFKQETGCSSVMLARAAQWNPSIFRNNGMHDVDKVIKDYLTYAVLYDNDVSNSKYCIQQVLHKELDTERGRQFQSTRLLSQICEIFGMAEFFENSINLREKKQTFITQQEKKVPVFTKINYEDGLQVIQMPFVYSGKEYSSTRTPKSILHDYCHKKRFERPKYQCTQNTDKMYTCIVTMDNQMYSSSYSDLSKKCGEQAAAVVCLRYLGMDDGRLVKSEDNRNSIAMQTQLHMFPSNKRMNEDESNCRIKDQKKLKHFDDDKQFVDKDCVNFVCDNSSEILDKSSTENLGLHSLSKVS